jgi:uncharacterized protein YraI
MNLQTILNSTTAVLLLFGLAVLFVNVIHSALRLSRGHVRTGIVNVALVLGACAVITVGLVRVAFPATTAAPSAASTSVSGNVAVTSNASSSNAQAASAQLPVAADRNVAAGTLPAMSANQSAPNGVSQGQGGFPAASNVQAGQSAGQAPQAGPSQQASSGSTATGNASTSTTAIPASRLAAVGVIGAVLVLVAGLILYFGERRKQGFEPSASAGLLYIGAGIFVLVAALVLPGLPGQSSTASAAGINLASLSTDTGSVRTRVIAQSSTPTATPVASSTATEVPTLTPIPSTSPTALFTAIAYAGSTEASTTTTCTVTATTRLNLRGDPSTKQMAIGKVFAGSLLPVTGQSADKKWWRVIASDGGSPVEGWVSADYVTTMSGCANASIPVIEPTPTATATPRS